MERLPKDQSLNRKRKEELGPSYLALRQYKCYVVESSYDYLHSWLFLSRWGKTSGALLCIELINWNSAGAAAAMSVYLLMCSPEMGGCGSRGVTLPWKHLLLLLFIYFHFSRLSLSKLICILHYWENGKEPSYLVCRTRGSQLSAAKEPFSCCF